MSITKAMTMAMIVASVSVTAMAESEHHPEAAVNSTTQMPMTSGQMPMMGAGMEGIPMMKMMQERQAMMQGHMMRMEAHMVNIEALLQQLVELQKK